MNKYKMKVSPVYYQTFAATLGGVRYHFDLKWDDESNGWIYTVYDKNLISLSSGRVIRLDVDLFGNMDTKNQLKVEGVAPTKTNLGIDCFFYFYSEVV